MDPVREVEHLAGFDWGSIAPRATARGLALALSPLAGGMPPVTDYSGYSEINFTPEQRDRLAEWTLTQLRKEPGPVRVSLGPIALRVVTRQYWPWFAGAVALGLVAGYTLRRGK